MRYRRMASKVRRSYQRTLLAAYWLSDGLVCTATNRELADVAGVSAETVKSYLGRLEADDVLTLFFRQPDPQRLPNWRDRVIVLLDDIEAPRRVATLEAGGYRAFYRNERRRHEEEAAADWREHGAAYHAEWLAQFE